mmetsp:Transcript_26730/g.61564  ORF Transcript_26730/g.61564 Transcript_26730/m.61564 type:complete len:925 (+) Transcript_26730:43-2817(+)
MSQATGSPVVGLAPPSVDRHPSITARPSDDYGVGRNEPRLQTAVPLARATPIGLSEPMGVAQALPTLTSLPNSMLQIGSNIYGTSSTAPSRAAAPVTSSVSPAASSQLQLVPSSNTVAPVEVVRPVELITRPTTHATPEGGYRQGRLVSPLTQEVTVSRQRTPETSPVLTVAGPAMSGIPASTLPQSTKPPSPLPRSRVTQSSDLQTVPQTQVLPSRQEVPRTVSSPGSAVRTLAPAAAQAHHDDLHPALSGRAITTTPAATTKAAGVSNQCACGSTFKADSVFCRTCGRKRPDVSKERSPAAHDEREDARKAQASPSARFREAAQNAGRMATVVNAMQSSLQPMTTQDPALKALDSEVHNVTMQALHEYHHRHSDPEEQAARQRAKAQPPPDNLPGVHHKDRNGLRVQSGGGKENVRSFALPEPLPAPTGVGHEAVALLNPPQAPPYDPSTAGLEREVAAREMELKALRTEVAAKEEEAQALRQKVQDAGLKLVTAAGVIDTLSVKVETTAGNQHAVLEASAKQIDAQVSTLRRRLAHMEWELAEKDDEIKVLEEAATVDSKRMAEQQGELGRLAHNQAVQGMQMQQLAKDAHKLHRHMAVNDWKEQVQAKIEQENADSFVQRERSARELELQKVDMENKNLIEYIRRMESKCRQHTSELHSHEGHMLELLMEERMALAAAQLGHQASEQERRNHHKEHSELEGRLQKELHRAGTRSGPGNAYDQYEAKAKGMELELQLMTECMRQVAGCLREPGGASDSIDAAMAEFQKSARELGEPMPPVARIGPNEYLIGHECVHCALMEGQLLVRPQDGGLIPIGDFMLSRTVRTRPPPPAMYGNQPMPPGAFQARSAAPPPMGVAPQVPQAGLSVNSLQQHQGMQVMREAAHAPAPWQGGPERPGQPYGMPALVRPMTIGGAEPLMSV